MNVTSSQKWLGFFRVVKRKIPELTTGELRGIRVGSRGLSETPHH